VRAPPARSVSELAHRGHRRSASTPVEELLASEFLGSEEPSGADGLAEDSGDLLASLDPKRAKRIMANRQSAARSKERKLKHTQDLERRVAQLQTELAAAGAAAAQVEQQVGLLARERSELETHLDALERHKCVRDATRAALQQAAVQHEAAQAAQQQQQQQQQQQAA
jgi:chromosome segregation ATPase